MKGKISDFSEISRDDYLDLKEDSVECMEDNIVDLNSSTDSIGDSSVGNKYFKDINNILVAKIKKRMDEIGVNARQLAEKAKVGKSFVYDILNGKSRNPTSKKLNLIARELGVSISYLMSSNDEINYDKYVPVYSVDSDKDLKALLSKSFCVEHFIQDENLYTYRMDDDSMEPSIMNNDNLIIQKNSNIFRSGVFLIKDKIADTIIIRRMENIIGSTKIKMIPDNNKYSVYIVENNDIEIIGRVILLIKGC